LIKLKPYDGVMVGVQQVRKSSSIQVYGINRLTSDHLILYFESIGIDVADAKLHAEQDYAVVDFTDDTGKNVCLFLSHTQIYTYTSW